PRAAGIVVDGPVTDLSAIANGTVPVYATGTTARTTKLLGADQPRHGVTVVIAGVTVRPGDIVLGDENGVLVIAPDRFDPRVVETARASDEAEPAILDRIARGDDLAQILTLTARPYDHGTELA
ncbi:RraA family protein, partial [Microbacterium sp. AGC85]